MELEYKKSAVDLTDLALGIVVLGIVVTIGATVLVNMRNTRLTDLTQYTTTNETQVFSSGLSHTLNNIWVNTITSVYNQSNASGGALSPTLINSGNYSLSVDGNGVGTVTNLTNTFPYNWSISYTSYNTTSRQDWSLANNASQGLAEYGNWFTILVIVGIAAVILALIFMAFGKRGSEGVTY